MTQERQVQTINIDLDQLISKGKEAVRRANLLVGLGLNSLEKCDETDLTVKTDGIFTYYIFPQQVSIDDFDLLKIQYAKLILRNGLREFIEYISLFYGNIYHVCILTLRIKGFIESEDDKKITVRELGVIPSEAIFKNQKSFQEKLKILKNKFGISTSQNDLFKSLNTLRHIHTHHDGIVPECYARKDGIFRVHWLGMDILIEEESGKTNIVDRKITKPILLESPGQVKIVFVDKEKAFKIGEFSGIDKEEFVEIGFAADRAIEEYRPKIVDFMTKYGVQFV